MVSRLPHREVHTFRDALGLALDLESQHPHGHFAVIVGPGGQVLQILARLAPADGAAPAASTGRFPSVELFNDPASADWQRYAMHGGSLLIVSIDASGVSSFGPAQSAAYLRHRCQLAARGITLIDWIQTDGDLYQSAAYTLHPDTAWLGDPPAERLAEVPDTPPPDRPG